MSPADGLAPERAMPWPLTMEEFAGFTAARLLVEQFEAYFDQEEPPVRRFRISSRSEA
jgi:hypothetical protein